MKNRNLILSVIFWAIASVSMAVVLPSSPFSGSSFYSDMDGTDFSISTGTSFTNFSLRVSDSDDDGIECAQKVESGRSSGCEECCTGIVESLYGEDWLDATGGLEKYGDCMTTCDGWSLGDEETPLGTPLCLLAFIAIYAVIRKRKEAVMA